MPYRQKTIPDSKLLSTERCKTHFGNFQAHCEFLRRTTALGAPCRVLEIGSGTGNMMRHLLDEGHDVVGIDISHSQLLRGVSLQGDLPIAVASGAALPFAANYFDVVVSLDVFEHISDTDMHLREVWRVLKPKGVYLLQTPNKWLDVPFSTLKFARMLGLRNAFKFLQPPHHCSLHSYRQIKERFRKNRFDIRFHDVPVVNEYFESKVHKFLGRPGLFMLRITNPDQFWRPLRIDFFVEAQKTTALPSR